MSHLPAVDGRVIEALVLVSRRRERQQLRREVVALAMDVPPERLLEARDLLLSLLGAALGGGNSS